MTTTNPKLDIRPGTYTIDPATSTCRLFATHAFGLKPVTATMAVRGGTVTVAADPARSTASAELDAGTFHTDDPRRDRDITGKRFLDTARHPAIAFRSTGCARSAEGWLLTGVLRVRDVDSEVTMLLTAPEETTTGFRCTARGTLDRVTAGVRGGRGIIARPIRIELAVTLAR
jgi:polyisoprenoid-binding protein YceI